MFCEPKEPFPEIKTKKKICRSKNTLQFLIYEKICFFIIIKYSPLSGAKNFIKINNNELEKTISPEIFI